MKQYISLYMKYNIQNYTYTKKHIFIKLDKNQQFKR